MSQELQIQMKKFAMVSETIEAIEVTQLFINSLPNAGATLQRFGEQVEILHGGPVKKKSYAQIGEYVICVKDEFGIDRYVVVSGQAFKILFTDAEPTQAETLSPSASSPAVADGSASVAPKEAPKLNAKEEKRKKRLKELEEVDTNLLETPIEDNLDTA